MAHYYYIQWLTICYRMLPHDIYGASYDFSLLPMEIFSNNSLYYSITIILVSLKITFDLKFAAYGSPSPKFLADHGHLSICLIYVSFTTTHGVAQNVT